LDEQRREASQNAADLQRKSQIRAEEYDSNLNSNKKTTQKASSLIPCLLWEHEGKQAFTDLFNLMKSGVPSVLRPFVWGELLGTKIFEKQQKRLIQKNQVHHPKKISMKQSLFQYFLDISQRYDCVSFRQID